jgi:hypothetical protein
MKRTRRVNSSVSNNKNKVDLSILSFHETFPITLRYKKSKEKMICYFQCKEHMLSYVKRYKLTAKDYELETTLPKEVI